MTDAEDLDPRLSAYLDGELDAVETEAVRQLLETSATARSEFERVRDARDLVRSLPLLDPPPEVLQLFRTLGRDDEAVVSPLTARRRTRGRARAVVMSAVATAAFWGVVVSSPDLTAAVSPSLESAVAAHTLVPDDSSGEMSVDDTDMPAAVGGGDLELVHAARVGRATHAVYSDGLRQISVFEEPGRVDWGALPEGYRVEIGGAPAWHGQRNGYDVVVVERGRRVYTIVAESETSPMMDDVSMSMPADDSGVFDRIRDASYDVTRLFGFRG